MTFSSLTTQTFANLCKAVSDPLRLMILRVLQHNSFGVLELTQLFETTQSGMSHHLKVLSKVGLVATRREGNTIFYRRTLPLVQSSELFYQVLFDEIDALDIPDSLQQNINVLYATRAELSRVFFANLALSGDLAQQDDVIVSLDHYQDAILGLLESEHFVADAIALEIGPGEGKFLPELAKRFKHVIAVDNSVEMLQLVESRCQQLGLQNITLQNADATTLKLEEPVDCIISNMVLHHLPAPIEALKSLASCLKDSGSLLLTELCHHEQSWVTDTCGDLWLGFDPDELDHWAKAAGLTLDKSLYIGLRNGFQLQIKRFCIS